ncbi:hypothetical protein [Jiangella alkaliphila]|nr:hypothetical protein [Jiangella alkaliphila]
MTLGILAILLLLAGLITLLASQPSDASEFYVDDGSPGGRLAGAVLIGAGALLCVAWLGVGALLWKPERSRPRHVPDPQLDRIAPEPPL